MLFNMKIEIVSRMRRVLRDIFSRLQDKVNDFFFSSQFSTFTQNLKTMQTRRDFLRKATVLGGAAGGVLMLDMIGMEAVHAAAAKVSHLTPTQAAQDEDFWFSIREAYSVSPAILNLNNGGVSPQPIVTQNALDRFVRIANEGPAYYMWRTLGDGRETIRTKLAELAGVSPEEIAINRNSSEALETIIYGLDMKAGDEVLTTTQDYPNMMNAWHQRVKRDGVVVNQVKIPVPPKSFDEIVQIFRAGMTPKTKIVHLCHMINLSGQILPVAAIADMAHEHGCEVICDAAHTFAHIDYKITDLHCDYFGTSLHKWLCAPFGTGMLWIKKEKIGKIWPLFGAPKDFNMEDIRKFEHLGTRSFPIELAIGTSIDFHNGIGAKRKEERLRFLTHYWAERVSAMPKVKMNTLLKPEMSCAIANFGIEGMEPGKIQEKLFADSKIYTTTINHDEIKGVRVTPHVYTSLKDLDYFVRAVEKIAKS